MRWSSEFDLKRPQITGLVWQAMGLFGTIMCVCEAEQHNWTYNGIAGIRSNLLGTGLMLPLVVCVILFVAGSAFVIWELLKGLLKK